MKQLVMVCALLGACGGGAKAPAQPKAAAFPPGPCVDPVADFTARFTTTISPEAGVDRNELADLDGDGVADTSASTGLGFMADNSVYILRGTCGHFVGDVGSEITEVLDTKSNGLSDLKITDNASACEGARCGCEEGYLVFKFDGTEYKQDDAASHPAVEKACEDEGGEAAGN